MLKLKEHVMEYIKKTYGVTPEYPWAKYPEYATFKAGEREKWFAIIMHVSPKVLERNALDDGSSKKASMDMTIMFG